MVRGMSRKIYEVIASNINTLVLDVDGGKILNRNANKINALGYTQITLGGISVFVHQVFAVAKWGEGCIGMTIKFKNDVKADCRSKNLQLVYHATGTKLRGCHVKPQVRIKATNLATHVEQEFKSQGEASRVLNVCQSAISFVINGKYEKANGYFFEKVVQ